MNANRSFILCATDFSPEAAAAAGVAAKLALCRNEKLRLVHATHLTRASVRAALQHRLESEVERLRQSGVEVEALLLGSLRPVVGLVDYIRKERPGLTVVGSGIKGPFERWALGSFSEHVTESSPVPTLIVRNPSVFDAWDWTRARLTILLALDFYSSSDVVLRWAKQFRLAGLCDFIACHINWRLPTLEESATGAEPANSAALQHRLERDLHKKVRDQLGEESMETVVRLHFGEPGAGIVRTATERKAHIIAIGAHQRHGVHRLAQFSVSREVLHRATTNVLCVPITARFDAREAHLPDFHRVLVTTDFSDLGNTAIPYACAACCIGGLVKIVHVVPRETTAARRRGSGWRSDILEQLRALIPLETGARQQPPEVDVLIGADVAKTICEEAERFGADVVCIASHGMGASRALHGSVTKAVLKRLRRPLLVIRRPDE